MKAQCQCGQLSVLLPSTQAKVAICHCIACQRRSGSPFGVVAYYPQGELSIQGEAKNFERPTDEGNKLANFFCPACGSTVYVRSGKHPMFIGVPIGAIADPHFQAPAWSVWEQSMHYWVKMPEGVEHFPKGRG